MATLRELCQREGYSLHTGQSIREAAQYMAERKVGAVAILEGDRLAGILSERDVLTKVVAHGLDPAKSPVSAIMTQNPVVVDISETMENCLRLMIQEGFRHLPVVEDGKLMGMVSVRDLLQRQVGEQAEEIRMMRAYIHST